MQDLIDNLSKISIKLLSLSIDLRLSQRLPFYFSEECLRAFNWLKETLTSAPILHPPILGQSFELMGNAFDFAVGLF